DSTNFFDNNSNNKKAFLESNDDISISLKFSGRKDDIRSALEDNLIGLISSIKYHNYVKLNKKMAIQTF
ncbi:uncharacterized protein ASCRUDRAFT_10748, partial [Ascoidea rubescens DSM 1968]